MAEEIGFARTAAIKFLNALEGAADMTVVDFDTEVRVARFGRDDFPRLVERIRQRKVSGLTALYDAIGVYLDGASDRDGRTIMLLYTDGGDTRSTLTLPELMVSSRRRTSRCMPSGLSRTSPCPAGSRRNALRRLPSHRAGVLPGGRRDPIRSRSGACGTAHTIGYLSTNEGWHPAEGRRQGQQARRQGLESARKATPGGP
jgi:hypothetical protein